MHIERVDVTPKKDVYNPGDTLDVAVLFRERFIGQCDAGLRRRDATRPDERGLSAFRRSTDTLYEGQVSARQDLIGSCILVVRLSPVGGRPLEIPIGDEIYEIRPVRP